MHHTNNSQEVLDILESGQNVFLTGSAGSGKSHLISQFVKSSKRNIVVTATTGIAGLNIGGETIHRFLGMGIASRPFEAGKVVGFWNSVARSTKVWDIARWTVMEELDTIVIDEVSMLRRDQFELIDIILSHIRGSSLPFGGVQIVLVGDFLQLPPVVTQSELSKYEDLRQPYCFQSDLWNQSSFYSINLTSNYRQGEGEFLSTLEKIRLGIVDHSVKSVLDSRVNATITANVKPVKIFSLKQDVSKENIESLKLLPDTKYLTDAEYEGSEYDIGILKKESPAEDKLYYCKGAQVMMLTNEPKGHWVNGSMGIIEETNPIKIRLTNGHLVQVDMYTWERVNHKVKGDAVETTKVASMKQYPFKLAYSTTVHKSQGLTLDYIDVDLNNCFASGQSYVALSRGKTLGGLLLRGWKNSSIRADKEVLKFYNI